MIIINIKLGAVKKIKLTEKNNKQDIKYNNKKRRRRTGEMKSQKIATRDGHKQGSYISNKPYKSKLKAIEDLFEIGLVKS